MERSESTEATPLVSVVIPARDAERTLDRCLTSIRRQDYQPIEIIVVDNASTDRTREIASALGVTVLSAGSRPGIHRNVGVASSKGKFLLYIDSDMALDQGLIRECVELSRQHGYGALVIPEDSHGKNYWGRVRAFERNLYIGDSTMESPRFINRSWYESVGGFREELTGFEDMAMTNELTNHGCSVGRTSRRIHHDEGRLSLIGAFGKKRFWGRHMPGYRRAYPQAYRQQAGFRGAWTKSPSILIRHPLLTVGLVPLKATDALGLLVGSMGAPRPASRAHPSESHSRRGARRPG